MSIQFKDSQTETSVGLDQLALATPTGLEKILQSINEELTSPLRVVASSPNDRTITIESITITNPETSRKLTIPPIAGTTLPAFTSGTVAFPASSGGTAVVTPGLDVTLTVASGNFIKAGLALDINGDIMVTFGTEGASEAAAGTPAMPGGSHAIGFVVLQNVGGTIQNIGNTHIRQYAGGGGGGGSGSGDGEINYITNPTAEFTANDYITYADAAAATPVDGTGGSPNVTFARSTVAGELIRGDGVFKLSKDAANRQGQGFSTPFEISKADNNKLLKIEMEYRTTANFASGDLGLYIYDIDTSTLITPSVAAVTYTGGISKLVITWASHTTSLNYRLIGHIATTNALAWDFIFDRVIVGPGVVSTIGIVRREYLYNSQATANTNNTTSFGNGAGGTLILAHSATTTLRVQASTTIAAEDTAVLEVSQDGNEWQDAVYVFPAVESGGQTYGMEIIQVTGSNQQLDVRFYDDGATFSDSWSVINIAGWKWRVRFHKDTAVSNVGYNYVSYLANSAVTINTSNTTSFSESLTGVAILAHTANNVALRVKAPRSLNQTDLPVLQISLDGSVWQPADNQFPYMEAGASQYGMRFVPVVGVPSEVDVIFYKDGATGTETWTSINAAGWRWRLFIAGSGSPVGFGFATTTEGGLVSTAAQSFSGLKTFTGIISSGNVGIGTGSNTLNYRLQIEGGGNAFTNGTATNIGSFSTGNYGGFTPSLTCFSAGNTGSNSGAIALVHYAADAGYYPTLILGHSNSNTAGVIAYPSNDQILGSIRFAGGHPGLSRFETAASIDGFSTDTWGPTASGTVLRFITTPPNSNAAAEHIRIGYRGIRSVRPVPSTGVISTNGIAEGWNNEVAISIYDNGSIVGSTYVSLGNITLNAGWWEVSLDYVFNSSATGTQTQQYVILGSSAGASSPVFPQHTLVAYHEFNGSSSTPRGVLFRRALLRCDGTNTRDEAGNSVAFTTFYANAYSFPGGAFISGKLTARRLSL